MRTSGAQNTLLHTSHTRHLEGCLAHPFSVTSRASPTDPPKMSDTPSLGTQSPRPAPIPTVISYKHRAYATMPPPNQFPPLIQAYTTAQSFLLRPGEGKKQVGRHKRCTPGAHANLGGTAQPDLRAHVLAQLAHLLTIFITAALSLVPTNLWGVQHGPVMSWSTSS